MEGGRRHQVEEQRRRVVEGSVTRTLLSLAAPIMASRLLGTVQESVDTAFLGRLGKEQLAAPIAVWPLIMMFMGMTFAVGAASNAIVSQLVGARRYREAAAAAGELWGLALALGSVSAVVVAGLAPLVFRLLGVPPEVYPLSLAYVWIEAVSMPFAFTMFFFVSLSSSLGDTRKPFRVTALSSLLNLALDPILIFGLFGLPRMEVIGAALATGVSRIVAGGYAAGLMLAGSLGFPVAPRRPGRRLVTAALKIGSPVAAQQVLVSLGFLSMTGIVAGLGATVMAAYNVSLAVIHLIQAFTMGFTVATAVMVGQSLGAGLTRRAREVALKAQAILFSILSVGATAIVALRGYLAAVFTSDPEVYAEAVVMVKVFAPSIPFLGLLFTANGVARGSGNTVIPSAFNVARLWLLRIPLSYLLAYNAGMGSTGVWLGMAASNVAAGMAATLWVVRGSWARPRALEEVRVPGGLPAGGGGG